MTKREMFKEIFFDATNGKRTKENFVDGMYLIDVFPTMFSKSYIEGMYNDWSKGEKSAKRILCDVGFYMRIYGTKAYKEVGRIIGKFFLK